MADASYLSDQAARFERVAEQCTIPDLVPYYRNLARQYRERAAAQLGLPLGDAAARLDGEIAD